MSGSQVWDLAKAWGGDFAPRVSPDTTENTGEARVPMVERGSARTHWTFYFACGALAQGFCASLKAHGVEAHCAA